MGCVVSITLRPRFTPVRIVQEAVWAPEPVWTQARVNIRCLCRGSNPYRPVVQSVVRHYTA
jgi:hypothetical protein